MVVGSREFDLTYEADVARMYATLQATAVVRVAAVVGGIGANRAHPGKLFYDNLIMGVQLMEFACRAGVKKFVGIGTICSYSKYTPLPFQEQNLWNEYPEETNAPYGLAKKIFARSSPGLPAGVRFPRGAFATRKPLRAGRQIPPGARARDSGPDPQVRRRASARRARGRAVGRRQSHT
jgi:hypothetical protein